MASGEGFASGGIVTTLCAPPWPPLLKGGMGELFQTESGNFWGGECVSLSRDCLSMSLDVLSASRLCHFSLAASLC